MFNIRKKGSNELQKAAYLALAEKTGETVNMDDFTGSPTCSYRIAINKKSGEQITEKLIEDAKSRIINQLDLSIGVEDDLSLMASMF